MSNEQAKREMEQEFIENCIDALGSEPEIHDGAYRLLHEFFDINIGALLAGDYIEWAGKHKKFSLACAAGLGRNLGATSKQLSTPISEEMVRMVTRDIIPCWERTCPLPPTPQSIPDREAASAEPEQTPMMGCLLRPRLGMHMP